MVREPEHADPKHTDALHPNEEGYRVWGKAMEPAIAELSGEDPSEGEQRL